MCLIVNRHGSSSVPFYKSLILNNKQLESVQNNSQDGKASPKKEDWVRQEYKMKIIFRT